MIQAYISLALQYKILESLIPYLGAAMCFSICLTLILLARGLRDERWVPGIACLYALQALVFLTPLWSVKIWPWLHVFICFALQGSARYLRRPTVEKKFKNKWLFFIALIVISAALYHTQLQLNRLPLFLCLTWSFLVFTMALVKNGMQVRQMAITPNQVKVSAYVTFALLIACYAAHAFHPVVAEGFFSSTIEALLNIKLVRSLDMLVMTPMVILYLAMFFGALYVLLGCMVVLSPNSDSLVEVTAGATEFLDQKGVGGVLKDIGTSMNASFISLSVKTPGTDQLALWAWLSGSISTEQKQETMIKRGLDIGFPVSYDCMMNNSLTRLVLEKGEKIEESNTTRNKNYQQLVPGMRSCVVLPIVFQGAVIAAINVEWPVKSGYSATAVRRLENITGFLSAHLHTLRQQWAIFAITKKIKYNKSLDGILKAIIDRIQSSIEPMEVKIEFSSGFVTKNVASQQTHTKPLPELWEAIEFNQKIEAMVEDVADEEAHKESLGTLYFKVPVLKENQKLTRYSYLEQAFLARDKKMRQQVAAVVKYHLEEEHHVWLTKALTELRTKLHKEAGDEATWHKLLEDHAMELGICWVDVSHENIQRKCFEAMPWRNETWNWDVEARRLQTPCRGAHVVVRLRLETSHEDLFLGIMNPDFGWEVHNVTPWASYLSRLRECADQALHSIKEVQLGAIIAKLELESLRSMILYLWFHEIGNVSASMEVALTRANLLLQGGHIESSLQQNKEIEVLIKKFKDMSRMAIKPIQLDSYGSSFQAEDLINLVRDYFGPVLAIKGVELEVSNDLNEPIDALFSVAFFALTNLTVNAYQALNGQDQDLKRIEISAFKIGTKACIRVCDNGPGVLATDIPQLFKQGFTTKPKGTGFGLSGSRAALNKCGGDLTYAESLFGTSFEIRLPLGVVGQEVKDDSI